MDRPQKRRFPGDCHKNSQPQPAGTANKGKTTITWRVPALYFTNMLTKKSASEDAAGATAVQRVGRWLSWAHSPTRHGRRNGSGVFTPTATRKKYHHPPFFTFPSRYADGAPLFSAQEMAAPRSKAGAGSRGSLSTMFRAMFRTGAGKCWKEGIDWGGDLHFLADMPN